MNATKLSDLKTWINDELKQAKPFYKRVKRITLYKNNQPVKLNRKK
jgi:hypothetical protein